MSDVQSVVMFYRKKGVAFSIENVFNSVSEELEKRIQVKRIYCPYRRIIPLGFLKNLLYVIRHAGKINHITGDSHYLALGLPRKGMVLTIHDCGHAVDFRGLKGWLYLHLWFKLPVRRAAAVTCISDHTKSELEKILGYTDSKIVVVENPVSGRFSFVPRYIVSEKPRILFIGTKRHKNLLRLSSALRGIDCHLRIIGRIPEADLEQLKADGVEFSSACNLSDGEIVEEYASADIVALVSTFEGFGMPVVEGQASGCPVVASHCCSIPSVAGDGAAFVDPLSIDSIRQGFLRVIEDESYRRQIIDRGYENVQRFRPEKIASRYLEIYEQCEKGTL